MHKIIDERAEQFHVLADTAEHFNSDLTSIIGRDTDDSLLFVACFARGEDAAALAEFLEKEIEKP